MRPVVVTCSGRDSVQNVSSSKVRADMRTKILVRRIHSVLNIQSILKILKAMVLPVGLGLSFVLSSCASSDKQNAAPSSASSVTNPDRPIPRSSQKQLVEMPLVVTSQKGQIIMTQVGSPQPTISPVPRQAWLSLIRNPKTPTLRKIEGMLSVGESKAAERTARAFLAKQPGSVEGLTALALSLAMQNNLPLASYYASLVERVSPANPMALNIMALARVSQNQASIADLRKAQALFQRAMETSPTEIAAALNLGRLYLSVGNANSAVSTYRIAVQRCSCAAAFLGRGIAELQSKRYRQALASFNEVLRRESRHANARYYLALTYKVGFNDSKRARALLQQVLADQSPRFAVTKQRSQALLRTMGDATEPDMDLRPASDS